MSCRSKESPAFLHTKDRLGNSLVGQLRDFRKRYSTELPSDGRGLNLKADLAAYTRETRLLVKLASTGHVTRVLERFGRVLDTYVQVFDKDQAVAFTTKWTTQLREERNERIKIFRDLMCDEERLAIELGSEQQQVEVLALLKHDFTNHMEGLLVDEIDVMSDMYDLIARRTSIVLGQKLPSWFVSPGELVHGNSGYFFHGVRVSVVEDIEARRMEHREEACLKQAATWDRLHHPNIVRLLGACHVGDHPIFVHETAVSSAQERTCSMSWEPPLGWALGLKYLHEQGFGYNTFSDSKLLVRHFLPSKGVLCGLGLVQLSRQETAIPTDAKTLLSELSGVGNQSANTMTERKQQQTKQAGHTAAGDVYGFGIAVMNRLMVSNKRETTLPDSVPFGLNDMEWCLVQKMCTAVPENRVNMTYVVHQLQDFVEVEKNNSSVPVLSIEVKNDEDTVTVRRIEVQTMVDEMRKKCEKLPEDHAANARHLRHRLDAAFKVACTTGDDSTTWSNFCDVLNRVLMFLDQQNAKRVGGDKGDDVNAPQKPDISERSPSIKAGLSEIAIYCATHAEAQMAFSLHHEIDGVLSLLKANGADTEATASDVMTSSLDWKDEWIEAQHSQLKAFGAHLESTATLRNPEAQSEAAMLLQLEIQRGGGIYLPETIDAMRKTCEELEEKRGSMVVPSWFIPAYHVNLIKRIGFGSFAIVYDGKWIDANVVTKVLQDPMQTTSETVKNKPEKETESSLEIFQREVKIWSMMDHENVIKLYGACHVGERFFVCERANGGTLPNYLARSDPRPSDKWLCLYQAALGLRYLHNREIVHGDLKGNNILVGEVRKEMSTDAKGNQVEIWQHGKVKLTDFGLSVFKNQGCAQHRNEEPGAVQWKAPERLQKDRSKDPGPTVESDVFSFGMCIIEIMTGEPPWGSVPDAAVKYHVVREKLPPRPTKGFTNDIHWNLVERMCRFNPADRISMSAVVDALYTFRYAE